MNANENPELHTRRSDRQNVQVVSRSFYPAVDKQMRTIGADAVTYELDYVEATAEELVKFAAYGLSSKAAGHYFAFYPSATRDGHHFGAAKPEQLFSTAAARDAAIDKYFAGAQKRAAKKVEG